MDHATYDKIRLLHDLNRIVWFIEKHAKKDAKEAGDMKCHDVYEKCAIDLSKYIDAIHNELYKKQV
jgi:hypothetical protein